jgi:hypothetical protein
MKKGHFLCVLFILHSVFFLCPGFPPLAQGAERSSPIRHIQNSYIDIQNSRKALADVIAFMNSRPDLFPESPPEKQRVLSREDRVTVWQTWQRFLDPMVALALLEQQYAALEKADIDSLKEELFYVNYAIFLCQYRYALAFIQIVENDPGLHRILNDPVPEIGLPGGTYSDLKFDFLNIAKGARFARLDLEYVNGGQSPPETLAQGIREDRDFIWEAG